jgi:hypothetical protein
MKVYVVIEGFDSEGYSEPNKVFDSLEKAETFRKELYKEVFPADYVDIIELELL